MILGNYASIILRHRAYLVARFSDRSVISSFRWASTLTQPSHPRESIDSVTTFRVSQCIAVDSDSISCWPKPLLVWLWRVRDFFAFCFTKFMFMHAHFYQAPKEILLHELERLQKVLSNNLLEAKEHVRNSVEDFMEDKVRKLGPMIGHYFSTFQSLNVMTRNDMDRAVKKMYCFKSIRDAEEELFQAEQDWDSFLKEVDHTFDRLCGSVNDKELGSYGPCELKLTDVSTERLV